MIKRKGAVVNQAKRNTTIPISQRTRGALDSIKYPRQSYDSLIQEMLKFWKEKHSEYWTRRRARKVPVAR
jgi:hypothetical protein